jgi:formylglycine-generating enzyme required for sulfatase activity
MNRIRLAFLALAAALPAATHADTFGSGANAFTIDFVTIGNLGNANDGMSGGGLYFSPYGAVTYGFRMGVTEAPQDWITKATNSGLTDVGAGAWTGDQPAANITWYEAAAFVNWLNTSTGHQAAYDLTFSGSWSMNLWTGAEAWQLGGENLFRHKDAFYFLPSEYEWYKAAFHKNDGATGNYWDYGTAGDSTPTAVGSGTDMGTAVYQGGVTSPASVFGNGGLSAYGTRGQSGNVWEWNESAADGSNNVASENRVRRGGGFSDPELALRSTSRSALSPTVAGSAIGFRVASVPEPSSALLLAGAGVGLLLRWRRTRP